MRLRFLSPVNTSSFRLRATAVILKIFHPFKYFGLKVIFRIDEIFIQQLSAMFTCQDGKGDELSSQASRMLYKPR